ncbi:MAG: 1-acyl-sn-glycerol-3-phosphate acyltransferase [Candidatus Kerfeldbacteria bacterium]|nr:1-acyl-sn-glycerol-3-phosphate acyltransferase [Candidatus Kerfeldbacteria bacterium]
MARPYHVLNLTLLPLLRARIRRIEGREHLPSEGGFIIVANHQSWIDSGIIGGALYRSIRKSLRFIAQTGKYHFLGGIPIAEYERRRVLEVTLGYLRAGHPAVIFPEGNSNPEPALRPGRTGAARLALMSGLPVVPVGVFPKHEELPEDRHLLYTVTGQIMVAISQLCGKPYSQQPEG